MVVYFSGTGNSRYAARAFAKGLGEEPVDAGVLIKQRGTAALTSESPWVFVCPTYAWRIPRVFEDFIRRTAFAGSREAYFVMTCGGEIGNAARYLRALCEEKGFVFKGVLQLVMPENYIAMFDVPAEEECDKIREEAKPALRAAIGAVREGRDFPAWRPGWLDKVKSGVVNEGFYRFYVKDRKFSAGPDCSGCGLCESLCPPNNIRLVEGRPQWGGNCTHCMACICHCPAQAIEYGKTSRGKRRYRCLDWEG